MNASLLYAIAYTLLMFALAYGLHRRGWFLKISAASEFEGSGPKTPDWQVDNKLAVHSSIQDTEVSLDRICCVADSLLRLDLHPHCRRAYLH